MKLNLGCCDRHLPGYVNVDLFQPCDLVADLTQDWPWPNNLIDEVVADDVLEHLPSISHTMHELWRVLKPGGLAYIVVPSTNGAGAWQDPTHCSYWNANTLKYFAPVHAEWQRFHKHYGIEAKFTIVDAKEKEYYDRVGMVVSKVVKLHALLVKEA